MSSEGTYRVAQDLLVNVSLVAVKPSGVRRYHSGDLPDAVLQPRTAAEPQRLPEDRSNQLRGGQ